MMKEGDWCFGGRCLSREYKDVPSLMIDRDGTAVGEDRRLASVPRTAFIG